MEQGRVDVFDSQEHSFYRSINPHLLWNQQHYLTVLELRAENCHIKFTWINAYRNYIFLSVK